MSLLTSAKYLKIVTVSAIKGGFSFFAIGVFVNIIWLILGFSHLKGLGSISFSQPQSLTPILALVTLLGFPIIYFLMGKKRGLMKGLQQVFEENKIPLLTSFFQILFEKWPNLLEKIKSSSLDIREKISNTKNLFSGQTFIIELLMSHFNSKASFVEAVSKAVKELAKIEKEDMDKAATIDFLAKKTGHEISFDFLAPSLLGPIILLTTHAFLIFGLIYFG
jgi:hypothetical protein